MIANKDLIDSLASSETYQDYEHAFNRMTGLPLSLRPVESWQLPHHGRKSENPFCALMAAQNRSCAACLKVQETLSKNTGCGALTVKCDAGMSDSAVPIKLGEETVGFLQTGQVFRRKPEAAQLGKLEKKLAEWKVPFTAKIRDAYLQTPVVPPAQYDATVRLLEIFARHLSIISNQLLTRERNAEPPMIARAKEFIRQNQTEELSLGAVAKAVNMSTFYFCKLFKKATGLHFTDYVSRVRIEKARNLLLNPNLRVSEIAYEIGFQSLTHFNRVFKNIVGQSPSEYRERLAA